MRKYFFVVYRFNCNPTRTFVYIYTYIHIYAYVCVSLTGLGVCVCHCRACWRASECLQIHSLVLSSNSLVKAHQGSMAPLLLRMSASLCT